MTVRTTGGSSQATGWRRLDTRNNALNAIRLLLALVVVASHSWGAMQGAKPPWANPGAIAVDGFFAISGFLIAGSRRRLSARVFALRRFLRIMPGYLAALATTVLVVAPLLALARGTRYELADGAGYFWHNLSLVITQPSIGALLSGAPVPDLLNASLWTLSFEAGAYIVFGLLLTGTWLTTRSAALLLAMLSVLGAGEWAGADFFLDPELLRLFAFFGAGVLLWLARESMPSSALLAGCGLVVVVVANYAAPYWLYVLAAPVLLAYALLWFGAHGRTSVGQRNDISYGMYVHAFPLQQLLVARGVASALGLLWFAIVSVAVTLPLAWVSWLVVERPSLRLAAHSTGPVAGRKASQDHAESIAK